MQSFHYSNKEPFLLGMGKGLLHWASHSFGPNPLQHSPRYYMTLKLWEALAALALKPYTLLTSE